VFVGVAVVDGCVDTSQSHVTLSFLHTYRRRELLFTQTRLGTAPQPLKVTRRQRKTHHTRTELLEERKKEQAALGMDASTRTFNNSLGSLLDYRDRRKHPAVLASQQPVSERTLRTTGGAGISNKTRSVPAYLPSDTPAGMANFQRKPSYVPYRPWRHCAVVFFLETSGVWCGVWPVCLCSRDSVPAGRLGVR